MYHHKSVFRSYCKFVSSQLNMSESDEERVPFDPSWTGPLFSYLWSPPDNPEEEEAERLLDGEGWLDDSEEDDETWKRELKPVVEAFRTPLLREKRFTSNTSDWRTGMFDWTKRSPDWFLIYEYGSRTSPTAHRKVARFETDVVRDKEKFTDVMMAFLEQQTPYHTQSPHNTESETASPPPSPL